MRNSSWRSLLATSLFAAGLQAQTLDSVLSGEKTLSTFYSLVQKYPDIIKGLPSGATVLAPNNAAFVRNDQFVKNSPDFITSVLQYHMLQTKVLAGNLVAGTPVFTDTLLPSWTNITGGLRVEILKQGGNVVALVGGQGSRSTLVQGDLPFTGGVVQIIDALLVPPGNITITCQEYNFTSFEGALYAADVLAKDSTTANLTIFAPQNAAFQALGSAITSMSSSDLAKIMDFHTLNEVIYSTSFENNTEFTTIEGGKLTVSRTGNNAIFINSAQLLAPDIMIGNGVLHVVDNVLNPSSSGTPVESLATQMPVFASASSVTNLPFTSNILVSTTSASGGTALPTTTSVKSSSSKALAAAIARETGFAAGLMVAIGGAAMLI
ncbi:fasciclin domain-containing protein [Hyaloscypha bicolor E]|uniref:Fasciclin domain-containing protein n=1 Tax=Hyaloscypha bicolor E TaxID=1095630 RepID=A0A2J6SS63_9HELO|nr:fasciclin domain-containing protein [Hyaloscypha bicolor E]PMD53621.1 fasciclin domain-containing protein [Hyaloscypha bicolor E]